MHISFSYGGYLGGVYYIMRTDVIPLLLHMSVTTPIIHMDDAYVSGILLRQLGIQARHSALFSYVRVDWDPCKSNQLVSIFEISFDKFISKLVDYSTGQKLGTTLLSHKTLN